jgi:hexosaminidase
MRELNLLPYPRTVKLGSGTMRLPALSQTLLDTELMAEWEPPEHTRLPAGSPMRWLGAAIERAYGAVEGSGAGELMLRVDAALAHPQAHVLDVQQRDIVVSAATPVGIYYGLLTLRQLIAQFGNRLPVVRIADAPDFPRRGVYVDVSRGKVPKRATLLALIDDLAALKINEFQLYVENVFEFVGHGEMHDDTTPLTAADIHALDVACVERCIDFVPSLTSLGHFDKILSRPNYRHLAEAEPEELKAQGIEAWSDQPWSLDVTAAGSRKLLGEMYDSFLPHFSSDIFNCCCDESWDLGKGRSAKKAAKIGVGQLYVDWVNYCARLAKRHGKKVQMWGDIILKHADLIEQLPKNATLLEWGYEAEHDFAGHGALFGKSGRDFYVAPGTSTWLTLAGRSSNAFGNMRSAAIHGKANGAIGFLNTDWGDQGHQQVLAVSLLPYAAGAALGWCAAANNDERILRGADAHLLRDPAGKLARLAYDLGQTCERIGFKRFNGSGDFFLFREVWGTTDYLAKAKAADLRKTIAVTKGLRAKIARSKLERKDAAAMIDELVLTADTIVYTCERTLARLTDAAGKRVPVATVRKLIADARELKKRFSTVWLRRNLRSRLVDVTAHFERHVEEYRANLV